MRKNGSGKKDRMTEYVMTGRLSEKGQLVLPKNFRDEEGLTAGSPIAILRFGNGLLLLPEVQRFEKLCESMQQTLADEGLTSQDLLDGLPRARREVFRKLYPDLAADEEEL